MDTPPSPERMAAKDAGARTRYPLESTKEPWYFCPGKDRFRASPHHRVYAAQFKHSNHFCKADEPL